MNHAKMTNTELKASLEGLDDGLLSVMMSIAKTANIVRDGFSSHLGASSGKNVYGETQQKLDVWSDKVITEDLLSTGNVKAVISEEQENPTPGDGDYVVTIDPLDGSSNIKSNNLFGTIVGIHKGEPLLVEGKKQVAAMYILYGPLTSMVTATELGVSEYIQDYKTTLFNQTKADIILPEPGKLISLGGNNQGWSKEFSDFVTMKLSGELKLRYGGAFVGDTNQLLNYGGFFAYPSTNEKPNGKLRLVIECNPLSFIVSKAGGTASNGKTKILDMKPKEATERTPIYMGNKDIIKEVEGVLK
jgi:fructose-1,6-bisphosphatase I